MKSEGETMNRNPSTIISYKGKNIFFSDYTHIPPEEFVDCINRHHQHQMEFIESQSTGILVLTDVTGSMANREVISCFKEKTKVAGSHIRKSAIIGVEGIQKLMLRGVNKFSRLNTRDFDTREEALDWLVE